MKYGRLENTLLIAVPLLVAGVFFARISSAESASGPKTGDFVNLGPIEAQTPAQRSVGITDGAAHAYEGDRSALSPAELAVFGNEKDRSVTVGDVTVAYGRGTIFKLPDREVLVASGQTMGAAHPDPGYLGIWYLQKRSGKWVVSGAYPLFVKTGSFGSPPKWSRASALGHPGVTLSVEGFGQWFGDATGWTSVIELGRRKPVMLLNNVVTSRYIPARDDDPDGVEQTLSGQIRFDPKNERFLVDYHGDENGRLIYIVSHGRYVLRSNQTALRMLR